MKNIVFTIIAILVLTVPAISDPGEPDTLYIESVIGYAGKSVEVPVYFYNDEPLSLVEMTIQYDDSYLSLDSFSAVGSRLENTAINSFDSSGVFDVSFTYFSSDSIQPGNGLLGNLYFAVSPASPVRDYLIDTVTHTRQIGSYVLVYKTQFADINSAQITPVIVPGTISVDESPPFPDSVWVQHVTGEPGQTVNVEIYAYNSLALDTVNLALNYSSGDIDYGHTLFAGTRAITAQSSIVTPNTGERELLISIAYPHAAPLDAGEGPIAIVQFDIDALAMPGEVTIDTTRFLGIQSLEFISNEGASYTPFFTTGSVLINTPTDINDDFGNLLPSHFALRQNAPNPFNPTTVIRFDLPNASNVKIDVFNLLGQNVKTLVNEFMSAGYHTVTFDGKDNSGHTLGSGIYFYRMTADDFQTSKKMTLIK